MPLKYPSATVSRSSSDFRVPIKLSTPVSTMRYKQTGGLLLLTALTLYSEPSPLFHLVCLPAMLLLQRHDRPLFYISTMVNMGIISSTRNGTGGREGLSRLLWHTFSRWGTGSGTLIGCINLHQLLVQRLGMSRAHGQSLLFGILWTAITALWKAQIGPPSITFTPSGARYESLRIVLRYTGEIGIDLLLSTTGHLVFAVLEVLLPSPPKVGHIKQGFEHIKLVRLHLGDQVNKPVGTGCSASSVMYEGSPEHSTRLLETRFPMPDPPSALSTASLGTIDTGGLGPTSLLGMSGSSSRWTIPTPTRPAPGQKVEGTPHERSSLVSPDSTTRPFEPAREYMVQLIDVETGQTYLHVIPPARAMSDQSSINSTISSSYTSEGPTSSVITWRSLSSIEEDIGIGIKPTPSTYGSTESSSSGESSLLTLPNFLTLPTLFEYGSLARNHLTSTILAILCIWALVLLTPLPDHLSLSTPLAHHTPLPVACIIPPPRPTISELVYLSQTVSGRVKLIVWPEDALVVGNDSEAEDAIDYVHSAIWVQHGVWTLMSLIVGKENERQRVLVGPNVWEATNTSPTQWSIDLPPPTGVTRFNWTNGFPHLRPVHLAATTMKHRSQFFIAPYTHPPSILLIRAHSQSDHHSASQLSNVQDLAVKHATPAVLCASSATGQGTSAVIDSAGRVLFQQSGGSTWTLSLALWFKEDHDRSMTGYEAFGGSYLLGTAVILCFAILGMDKCIAGQGLISCRREELAGSGATSRETPS